MRGRTPSVLLLAVLSACAGSEGEKPPEPGRLEVLPEVRFDRVPVLGVAEAKLVLKNSGDGRLSVAASAEPPFSVVPDRVDIPPHRFVVVTVRFAPVREGTLARTLVLEHRGKGARQVLLAGHALCRCDDGDELTDDWCGDLGECRHAPVVCDEVPPPCWTLDPGPDRGCAIVPLPDGTACTEATGLCHPGGMCSGGRCVVGEVELGPEWAVPIGDEAVLASGEDIYALGPSGELLHVDPAGEVTTIPSDLPAGARLRWLHGGRLLLLAGDVLIGRDTAGTDAWTLDLPAGTTEPWRLALVGTDVVVIGGTRRLDACSSSKTILLPVDPVTGRTGSVQEIPVFVPTGAVTASDGELRISGETCRGEVRAIFKRTATGTATEHTSTRAVLAAQGNWVFSQDRQYAAGGDGTVVLPASPGFDPLARSLEPLAGANGGWVFDCTGPDCDAPATALFFQPGASGSGLRVELGARPSALLLRAAGLLAASRMEDGALVTVARSTGVVETCTAPAGITSLVTLAGGKLIAVAPDPAGGARLVAFPARGLALADEGWVAQGGNPGRTRAPDIDLP